MTTPPRNTETIDAHRPGFGGCSVTLAGPQWQAAYTGAYQDPVTLTVDCDDDHYSAEVPLTEEQAYALLYVLMDALGLDRIE